MVGADFEDVGLEFEGVVGTDVVISNVILEGRCRLKTTTSMFKTNRKNQVSSSMMPTGRFPLTYSLQYPPFRGSVS